MEMIKYTGKEPMTIITLTTDFGIKDGNVGVMKGVILGIAPFAQLVDISHLISPQNIYEASLILARSVRFFPPRTVHLVVVDPGVGTTRRPIAAMIGKQIFVLPDNGILTRVLEILVDTDPQFIHLTEPAYWLPEISHVFHGRDIFAPVAAHLAAGVPLESLGEPISTPVKLDWPLPKIAHDRIVGTIIHVDHFGNLTSSIRREHLGQHHVHGVKIDNRYIRGMVQTFGDSAPGELIALYGSNDDLIIAIVNGDAARQLNASPGDEIEVLVDDERH
jgi:S-adenosyl-L-methionine hydrolase (adenosine-forming)